jgi:hypothetical protein
MYDGKDDTITVDDIAEQYLQNARLAAHTQRQLRYAAVIVVATILALTVAALIIRP